MAATRSIISGSRNEAVTCRQARARVCLEMCEKWWWRWRGGGGKEVRQTKQAFKRYGKCVYVFVRVKRMEGVCVCGKREGCGWACGDGTLGVTQQARTHTHTHTGERGGTAAVEQTPRPLSTATGPCLCAAAACGHTPLHHTTVCFSKCACSHTHGPC